MSPNQSSPVEGTSVDDDWQGADAALTHIGTGVRVGSTMRLGKNQKAVEITERCRRGRLGSTSRSASAAYRAGAWQIEIDGPESSGETTLMLHQRFRRSAEEGRCLRLG